MWSPFCCRNNSNFLTPISMTLRRSRNFSSNCIVFRYFKFKRLGVRTKTFKLIGFGLLGAATLGLYGLLPTPLALAQDPVDETLSDPVVLGAWLYNGNCVRCHGSYEKERIGSGYRDDDKLEAAIESDGCQVKWGRRYDGPLNSKDIKALADFILAWEALDQAPDLPELPEQPTPTPRPSPTSATEPLSPTPPSTPDSLTDEIKHIIEFNEVAKGAWLYTQHCYRCHQSYASYRQGAGMPAEVIKTFIEEGKTATQMTPFARKFGGPLFGSEIDAIVTYIVVWETLGAEPALPAGMLVAPTPNPALLEPVSLPDVPAVVGDAQRGAGLFALHCAGCHGVAGEGLVGPRLAKAWPSVRPDLTIQSIIAHGVPGSAMPAWSKNTGGPLSDEDISDLTALVLSWSRVKSITDSDLQTEADLSPLSGPLGLMVLVGGSVFLVAVGLWRNN
jgi:mono/diheme cytochrome c family protein